jgi:hypothetical protein
VRLRIDSLSLLGTTRNVEFEPGLNVVVGPISTGKTSLMKLIEVFLGGAYDGVSDEVNASSTALAGKLTLGDREYSVIRPLVQTATARVEIASSSGAERLPAMRAEPGAPLTYGVWLLEHLALPVLRVPQAPTRPEESAFIPVSINDYLLYCRLRQDEIDVDVFGSNQPYRDIKRRYVFRILYGGYDVEVAAVQEQLRGVQAEIGHLEGGANAFRRFLEGTALQNRAALEREVADVSARLRLLRQDRMAISESAPRTPEVRVLRDAVARLEVGLAERRAEAELERRSAAQLRELVNELQAQSARLTRAIVAGEQFVDFEFVVCPRCSSSVDSERAAEGTCRLCLQSEPAPPTRIELIREQDRISAQMGETDELIRAHEARAEGLASGEAEVLSERDRLGALLDRELATYLSDQAERLEGAAREEAALAGRERQLREYLGLYERLDDTSSRLAELRQRRSELEANLARAEQLNSLATTRIERLEYWLRHYVDALGVPSFGSGVRSAIDRRDFEPIVNGQQFSRLSAGVRVLVNIAHALAHHRAGLELDLPLPGFLYIDGVAKNIGTAGYDRERIVDIWRELISASSTLGESLQLIVAANDVPDNVREYVRLELDEDDRLIPAQDVRPRATPRGEGR